MVFSRSFWVVLIVLAACLNVAMNVLLQRASRATSFAASVRTTPFLGALGAGTLAVLLLLLVYRTGMPLARGVLLLGATSVLVGVLAGLALGDRLRVMEWLLFGAVLCFYLGRWVVRE